MATLGDVHAEVPAETGKNLVACMVCRLLKTFDQARMLHSAFLAAVLRGCALAAKRHVEAVDKQELQRTVPACAPTCRLPRSSATTAARTARS